MGEIVLETARLVLRQISEGDLDLQMALLNTPRVMEHLGGVQPREAIANKHRNSREGFAREGFGFMMAIERSSGELVGHCGIKRVDHPHAPNPGMHEIGWLVREDRWRRGYAYEAMRAVVDWGMGEIGAAQLVALTSKANTGSWKLMEKLGMERREDWDFNDPSLTASGNPIIQYALTAGRWAELKEATP